MHRGANYFVEPEIGYWNCRSMTHECQLFFGLHFLGEKNRQPGSTSTNPKFSERFSSGSITPHLLINSDFEQCHEPFKSEGGQNRQLHIGESCISCDRTGSKITHAFAEPPALLRELLTSKSA